MLNFKNISFTVAYMLKKCFEHRCISTHTISESGPIYLLKENVRQIFKSTKLQMAYYTATEPECWPPLDDYISVRAEMKGNLSQNVNSNSKTASHILQN